MSLKSQLLLVFVLFQSMLLLFNKAWNQNKLLLSGPKLGYSEMKEVKIGIQTTKEAKVQICYWNNQFPNTKKYSNVIKTEEKNAFVAHFTLMDLEPSQAYSYQVRINGKKIKLNYPLRFQTQKLWQHRTDPPSFSFCLGSCNFINDSIYDRPGKPYGGNYEIFTRIYQSSPDFMLWLGDNIYLREADWYSMSGIFHRYTHTFKAPELQPLLSSTHHYAIWDDHDYGPNDSDRGFRNKNLTLQAFKTFWLNPTYGIDESTPGITTMFQWADCDFFLLDNRTYRTPNHRTTAQKAILGEKQIHWLIDNLKYSKAPFKFVAIGGQLLNTAKVYENHINIAPEEREQIIELIKKEKISGVFFLTGDRHHTELSCLKQEDFYPLYDLTVSPLTAGPATNVSQEANTLRVVNTLVSGERNFAKIEIIGPKNNREMRIMVYNHQGKLQWQEIIPANQLTLPK